MSLHLYIRTNNITKNLICPAARGRPEEGQRCSDAWQRDPKLTSAFSLNRHEIYKSSQQPKNENNDEYDELGVEPRAHIPGVSASSDLPYRAPSVDFFKPLESKDFTDFPSVSGVTGDSLKESCSVKLILSTNGIHSIYNSFDQILSSKGKSLLNSINFNLHARKLKELCVESFTKLTFARTPILTEITLAFMLETNPYAAAYFLYLLVTANEYISFESFIFEINMLALDLPQFISSTKKLAKPTRTLKILNSFIPSISTMALLTLISGGLYVSYCTNLTDQSSELPLYHSDFHDNIEFDALFTLDPLLTNDKQGGNFKNLLLYLKRNKEPDYDFLLLHGWSFEEIEKAGSKVLNTRVTKNKSKKNAIKEPVGKNYTNFFIIPKDTPISKKSVFNKATFIRYCNYYAFKNLKPKTGQYCTGNNYVMSLYLGHDFPSKIDWYRVKLYCEYSVYKNCFIDHKLYISDYISNQMYKELELISDENNVTHQGNLCCFQPRKDEYPPPYLEEDTLLVDKVDFSVSTIQHQSFKLTSSQKAITDEEFLQANEDYYLNVPFDNYPPKSYTIEQKIDFEQDMEIRTQYDKDIRYNMALSVLRGDMALNYADKISTLQQLITLPTYLQYEQLHDRSKLDINYHRCVIEMEIYESGDVPLTTIYGTRTVRPTALREVIGISLQDYRVENAYDIALLPPTKIDRTVQFSSLNLTHKMHACFSLQTVNEIISIVPASMLEVLNLKIVDRKTFADLAVQTALIANSLAIIRVGDYILPITATLYSQIGNFIQYEFYFRTLPSITMFYFYVLAYTNMKQLHFSRKEFNSVLINLLVTSPCFTIADTLDSIYTYQYRKPNIRNLRLNATASDASEYPELSHNYPKTSRYIRTKVYDQGNIQAGGQDQPGLLAGELRMHHNININGNGIDVIAGNVNNIVQQLQQVGQNAVYDATKFIMKLTTMVIGLSTSTNFMNAASIVLAFAMDYTQILKFLERGFDRLRSKFSDLWVRHGGVNIINQGNDDAYDKETREAADEFREFVGYAATGSFFEFFKSKLANSFYFYGGEFIRDLRKTIFHDTSLTISAFLGQLFHTLVDKVKLCIETKSIVPLWNVGNPTKYVRYVNGLIQYYTILTANGQMLTENQKAIDRLLRQDSIPPIFETAVSYNTYLEVIQTYKHQGNYLKTEFSHFPTVSKKINDALIQLTTFEAQLITVGATGDNRIEPFAVCLFGPSAQGKTTYATFLKNAIASRYHFDPTSRGTYSWRPAANFQDGLDHLHWCIMADDIDQSTAQEVKGIPGHGEVIIDMINSRPLPIEKAGVNEKGKYSAAPTLFIYSTNSPDLKLRGRISEPSAVYRRFNVILEFKLKQEYLREGTSVGDSYKIADAPTYEMYDVNIMEFSGDILKPWNVIGSCSSLEYLNLYMFKEFERHRARALEISQTLRGEGELCEFCCLNIKKKCKCSQINFEDVANADDMLRTATEKFPGILKMRVVEQEEEESLIIEQGNIPSEPVVVPVPVPEPVKTTGKVTFGGYTFYELEDFTDAEIQCMKTDFMIIVGSLTTLVTMGLSIAALYKVSTIFSEFQSKPLNATAHVENEWVRVAQNDKKIVQTNFSKGVTWDFRSISSGITNALFRLNNTLMYGVVLIDGIVCVPYHAFEPDRDKPEVKNKRIFWDTEFTASFDNGKVIKFIPSKEKSLEVNHELCLFRIENMPNIKGLYTYLPEVRLNYTAYDQLEYISLRDIIKFSDSHVEKIVRGQPVIATKFETINGDCGSVLVACINSQWRAIGIHFGLFSAPTGKFSLAAYLTKLDVDLFIRKNTINHQGLEHCNQFLTGEYKTLVYGQVDKRSEVWAAMHPEKPEYLPFLYGRTDLPGSTNSVKTKFSLLQPYFIEDCKRVTGLEIPFKPPAVNGKMIFDEELQRHVWESPWTNPFKVTNISTPNRTFLFMALIDFLNGIDSLPTNNYGTISTLEALKGVPGTNIGSVDLNTSMGLPMKGIKRNYMDLHNYEEAYVHRDILQYMDDLEEILNQNKIPVVFASCARKDEAVKEGKLARIFCCLPASVNLLMKVYGSAMDCFMRNNTPFFESAVGINMTSRQCNSIIDHLKRVNPDLDILYDGDFKNFDKAWNGVLYDFVALAVYAINFVIGAEAQKCYLLVHMLKNMRYEMRGDVFHAFWNPSGNQWTVQLNSLLVCLMHRYMYYKFSIKILPIDLINDYAENFFTNPIPNEVFREFCTFRTDIALYVYGDDNVFSLRKGYSLPENYDTLFTKELGIVLTSAQKGEFKPLTVSTISFLKRNFVYDTELETYLPPLEEKSILKTLTTKKYSKELGEVEHAVVVIINCLRELVYHGREKYDYYLNKFKLILENPELIRIKNHPNLQLQTYDYYRDQIKNDTFSTWDNQTPISVIEEITHFEYQMNSDRLNNSAMAESSNDKDLEQTQTPTTKINYEVSSVIGQTSDTIVKSLMPNKISIALPQTNLKDFMFRAVEAASFVLTSADTMFSTPLQFDPWGAIFTSVPILQKTYNFLHIRSKIKIDFVVSATPACFGLYQVACFPVGGPAIGTDTIDTFSNPAVYMQLPNSGFIDISKSNTLSFTLPFLWPFDYVIPPLGGPSMWNVVVKTLQPITTSMPGGYSNAHVQVYVSFVPDDDFAMTVTDQSSTEESSGLAGFGTMRSTLINSTTPTRNETNPNRLMTISRNVFNPAPMNAQFSCDTASLDVNQAISPSNAVCYGDDEQSELKWLYDRYTLVSAASWTPAMAPNTVIVRIPVTPFFGYFDVSSNKSTLTTAGYIGMPFRYWAGTMKYLVYIPVSKMHQGALKVFWSSFSTPVPNDALTVNYTSIVQVSANNIFEVTIGFCATAPKTVGHVPSASLFTSDRVNGTLTLAVENFLVCPNSEVATTVFIWAKAGPDMQFMQMHSIFEWRTPTSGVNAFAQFPTNFQYQSDESAYVMDQAGPDDGALDSGPSEISQVILVPPSDLDLESAFGAEKFTNIKQLMMKPWKLAPVTVGNQYLYPYNGFVNATNDITDYPKHLSMMFVGVAGSEIFKVYANGDVWLSARRDNSLPYFHQNRVDALDNMIFVREHNGAEFRVPYYFPRKYIRSRLDGSTATNLNLPVTVFQVRVEGAPTSVELILYRSFGSDLRLSQFCGTPRIGLENPIITPSPWFSDT